MSTVKTTNLQHPSASDVGITLGADGSVVLPQGFTGGIGSNVVVATLGTIFTTTSATYQDTGLSATITPTAASSKVFALVTGIAASSGVDDASDFAIFRGDETGTNIAEATIFVGISQLILHGFALSAVDSPATASAQTYTLAIRRDDADSARVNANTRMILIEVAA